MAESTDKPTAKTTAPAPTVKVEVAPAPKPRTPHQDALDAKAERQKHEDKAKAEFDKLEEEGKIVAPAPLTGYEHERAKLGTPADEAEEGK